MLDRLISFPLRILLLSIVLLCGGVYEFSPFFMYRSQLVPIRGRLEKSEVKSLEHTDRNGEVTYIPTLFFTLKGDKHVFRLTDVTDFGFMGKEYDQLIRAVDSTMIFTVYVDPDDTNDVYPKVFQINAGDKPVLEFEQVRMSHVWLGFGLLIAGIAGTLYFLYARRN